MAYGLGTYKIAGTVYRLYPTELTKNGYPKRKMVLEFPTKMGDSQQTSISTFMVMGDDVSMLDMYPEGTWVEIMFKLDGFEWTKPETGEKICLDSHKIIDIHKGANPFEGGKSISEAVDDNSPDLMTELATNVRDYVNDPAPPASGSLWDTKVGDDDDLPF